MGFQQAAIKVQREKEFGALRDALKGVFAPEGVEHFLKRLNSKGIRIRDFELVVASGVLEQVDEYLAKSGARKLYEALPPSDRGQLREFYLSKIEEVDSALRTKYQKLYRYY
ncbi:MAG TPA: hypothetical protein VEV41_00885 [Terriglobales bacterium]|nr:hypothetical protein [Terriglobales bacterium]